ncbi:hypothetical protein BU26DRAFT_505316 [Trematosphaeria pertusa]|uniref:F-box domain-containing protein n=1 Tax=Trematosphaeria pertusa TaxID=390896 RepID=A0A6A6IGC3_9PLEO|nr:uncharacterized protein BU26DRAFT_505316 [Trematosphaeria pertusa]KAF2249259.1 hypothetical protein BU26DRAFT_505316 [Trematosphaeria pertusa]
MELLDLPPEIFQRVVAMYVRRVGLCEAWKLRSVCKTFSVYLTEEVFGRQPMKVYFRKSSNQLLKSGLAVYLECHTNALYGAHETLPTLIQKTVGEFMRISNESSDAKRAEYTSKPLGIQALSRTFSLVVPLYGARPIASEHPR